MKNPMLSLNDSFRFAPIDPNGARFDAVDLFGNVRTDVVYTVRDDDGHVVYDTQCPTTAKLYMTERPRQSLRRFTADGRPVSLLNV